MERGEHCGPLARIAQSVQLRLCATVAQEQRRVLQHLVPRAVHDADGADDELPQSRVQRRA